MKKDEKNTVLNRLHLIELKRKLTKDEYIKVQETFKEINELLASAFPEDLKDTLLIKTSVLDKRALHSQSSRLIDAANSISMIYDSNLSMKLIETNRDLASSIASDKNVLKEAVQSISSIISRRYKLRDKLFQSYKKRG